MKMKFSFLIVVALAMTSCTTSNPIVQAWVNAATDSSKYEPNFFSASQFTDYVAASRQIAGTPVTDSNGTHLFSEYEDNQVIFNSRYLVKVNARVNTSKIAEKFQSQKGLVAPVFIIKDNGHGISLEENWDATRLLHKRLSKHLKLLPLEYSQKYGALMKAHIEREAKKFAEASTKSGLGGLFASQRMQPFAEEYAENVLDKLSGSAGYVIDSSYLTQTMYIGLQGNSYALNYLWQTGASAFGEALLKDAISNLYSMIRGQVVINTYHLASGMNVNFIDTTYPRSGFSLSEGMEGRKFLGVIVYDEKAQEALIPKYSDPDMWAAAVKEENARNRKTIADIYRSSVNEAIKGLDIPGLVEKQRRNFIQANMAVMSQYMIQGFDGALPKLLGKPAP